MPSTDDVPTAVLLRRYVGYLIDEAVYAVAFVVPFLVFAERSTVDRSGEAFLDASSPGSDYALRVGDQLYLLTRDELILCGATWLAVVVLFSVLVQGWGGWTIGKALTGIRTVGKDGAPPGIGRALVRTLLVPIDALPAYLLPLVGSLTAWASASNRRLGDLVGGTYVVDKGSVGEDPTGDERPVSTWAPLNEDAVPVLASGETLRVGDPSPTAPSPTAPPASDTPPPDPEPAYQPQWDPARQAYLQWNPRTQTWLQFDESSQEWRPVDG